MVIDIFLFLCVWCACVYGVSVPPRDACGAEPCEGAGHITPLSYGEGKSRAWARPGEGLLIS